MLRVVYPFVLSLPVILLAGACSGEAEKKPADAGPKVEAPPPMDAADQADLEKRIADVMARPERDVSVIQVAHILIPKNDRTTNQPRPDVVIMKETYDLLKKIDAGADFLKLMKEHSTDPGPGVYTMYDTNKTKAQIPDASARNGMVPGFGNVGWRLKVGQIGIAPYHPQDSSHGYHIIKRVK